MNEPVRRYRRRQFLQSTAAVGAVVLFYVALEVMGITCPILYLTGVSCAGCGMSRAWIALLSGNPVAAAAYHPLFWIPPVVLIGWMLRRHLPRRLVEVSVGVLVALFLIVYALRMMDPEDTIVVFHPEEGLLLRTFRATLTHLQS